MSATVSSHLKRGLAALVLAAALFGAAQTAQANPVVYQKTVRGTGWIAVPLADNKYDYGTCWVLDREQKLVVTNYHVVKNNSKVLVRFPHFAGDRLNVDANFTWHNVPAHPGKVVSVDPNRDLALVQMETLPDHVRPLPLANGAVIGETAHSVGNSSIAHPSIDKGGLWRYTRGNVRLVRQHTIPMNVGAGHQFTINCRIVETDSPINPGDSGGPVVNDRGEVIAVVSGWDTRVRNVTWTIDVNEVRGLVQEYRNGQQVAGRE